MHLVSPISTDRKFCLTREILCRGDRNEKHKDFPWRREVFWRDTRNRLFGTSTALFRNNLLAPGRQVSRYSGGRSIRCPRRFAYRFQRARTTSLAALAPPDIEYPCIRIHGECPDEIRSHSRESFPTYAKNSKSLLFATCQSLIYSL